MIAEVVAGILLGPSAFGMLCVLRGVVWLCVGSLTPKNMFVIITCVNLGLNARVCSVHLGPYARVVFIIWVLMPTC